MQTIKYRLTAFFLALFFRKPVLEAQDECIVPSLPAGALSEHFSSSTCGMKMVTGKLLREVFPVWYTTPPRKFISYKISEWRRNPAKDPLLARDVITALTGGGALWHTQVCPSQIKYLIDKQPNGEEGFLLTNGQPNVFLVGAISGGTITVVQFLVSYCREFGGWSAWILPLTDGHDTNDTPGMFAACQFIA